MIAVPSIPMTPCAMPMKRLAFELPGAAVVSAATSATGFFANTSTKVSKNVVGRPVVETASAVLDDAVGSTLIVLFLVVLGAGVVVTSIGAGLFLL